MAYELFLMFGGFVLLGMIVVAIELGGLFARFIYNVLSRPFTHRRGRG